MKIEITGEPKEIAALVLAVQERQCEAVVETTDWQCCCGNRKKLKGADLLSSFLFYSKTEIDTKR